MQHLPHVRVGEIHQDECLAPTPSSREAMHVNHDSMLLVLVTNWRLMLGETSVSTSLLSPLDDLGSAKPSHIQQIPSSPKPPMHQNSQPSLIQLQSTSEIIFKCVANRTRTRSIPTRDVSFEGSWFTFFHTSPHSSPPASIPAL